MSDAWMVRGAERQELVQRLQGLFFRLDNQMGRSHESAEAANAPFLAVAILLFGELGKSLGNPPSYKYRKKVEEFLEAARKEIKNFARAPEEEMFIMAELAKKFLHSGLTSFHNRLGYLEMREPEKIFHAPSATSDV